MVCLVLVHVGVVLEDRILVSVDESEESYSKDSILDRVDSRVDTSNSRIDIVVTIETVLKTERAGDVLGLVKVLGIVELL